MPSTTFSFPIPWKEQGKVQVKTDVLLMRDYTESSDRPVRIECSHSAKTRQDQTQMRIDTDRMLTKSHVWTGYKSMKRAKAHPSIIPLVYLTNLSTVWLNPLLPNPPRVRGSWIFCQTKPRLPNWYIYWVLRAHCTSHSNIIFMMGHFFQEIIIFSLIDQLGRKRGAENPLTFQEAMDILFTDCAISMGENN